MFSKLLLFNSTCNAKYPVIQWCLNTCLHSIVTQGVPSALRLFPPRVLVELKSVPGRTCKQRYLCFGHFPCTCLSWALCPPDTCLSWALCPPDTCLSWALCPPGTCLFFLKTFFFIFQLTDWIGLGANLVKIQTWSRIGETLNLSTCGDGKKVEARNQWSYKYLMLGSNVSQMLRFLAKNISLRFFKGILNYLQYWQFFSDLVLG